MIQLSLLPHEQSRWELSGSQTLQTLSPSICRQRGCQSYFFILNGREVWC
ncbi:MAG: DUF6527 family protein [Saprospiraceae bacterium]